MLWHFNPCTYSGASNSKKYQHPPRKKPLLTPMFIGQKSIGLHPSSVLILFVWLMYFFFFFNININDQVGHPQYVSDSEGQKKKTKCNKKKVQLDFQRLIQARWSRINLTCKTIHKYGRNIDYVLQEVRGGGVGGSSGI